VPVNELSVFNPNTGARLMTLTPTNGEYNAGVITCTDDYVVKVSRAGTTNNVYIYNSTGALLSYTTYPNPSSYSNRNISMSGESILVGDGKNAFLLDITGNLVTTLSGNSTQYGVAVSIDENLMAVGQISNESTYQSEDVFVYN
jgi:hypothetical protein